jgi:hypothetical protein
VGCVNLYCVKTFARFAVRANHKKEENTRNWTKILKNQKDYFKYQKFDEMGFKKNHDKCRYNSVPLVEKIRCTVSHNHWSCKGGSAWSTSSGLWACQLVRANYLLRLPTRNTFKSRDFILYGTILYYRDYRRETSEWRICEYTVHSASKQPFEVI